MTSSHKHSLTGKSVVAGDIDAAFAVLDARLRKLESPPVVLPGLPAIPANLGTKLRWVPAETGNALAPFMVLTYPDEHIGQPGQNMTVFNRFTHVRKPTVHDGYLDLRATRRPDGLFDADLVGTDPIFGYGVFRFWLRMNIVVNSWQSAWLYDTLRWTATEIDFPEILESQSLTAHVLGAGAGSKYGIAKPADLATAFHLFRIERRASFVAYSIDGTEVARITGTMPADPLAILLDSKVGFPWAERPTATTPEPFLHVAGVTVDS